MTDNTEFEVIEGKFAELYQLQWNRIGKMMANPPFPDSVGEEIAEAREILSEWLWCLEAKNRARRRVEGMVKLD